MFVCCRGVITRLACRLCSALIRCFPACWRDVAACPRDAALSHACTLCLSASLKSTPAFLCCLLMFLIWGNISLKSKLLGIKGNLWMKGCLEQLAAPKGACCWLQFSSVQGMSCGLVHHFLVLQHHQQCTCAPLGAGSHVREWFQQTSKKLGLISAFPGHRSHPSACSFQLLYVNVGCLIATDLVLSHRCSVLVLSGPAKEQRGQ